jgi:subtilase family serine protease
VNGRWARRTAALVALFALSTCLLPGGTTRPRAVVSLATRISAAKLPDTAIPGTANHPFGKRVCKTPAKARVVSCLVEVLVRPGRPNMRRVVPPAAGVRSLASIGPAGGLTPSDLGTAYALTTTGGSGQTIAIVVAFNAPNIAADLGVFDTQYGLAPCALGSCLSIVNQTGGNALPTDDTDGWSLEATLDVETAHSVCQGCKILLVEANSASNADIAAAENEAVALHATEVSNSFGDFETTSDPAFESAFDHPGTVITAAAGDDGYYSFDQLAGSDEPVIPASYGTVVAVGGTSLYLGQHATRQSETVWNSNGAQDFFQQQFLGFPLGAGGGGCSTHFAAPRWQSHLAVWPSTGCGTMRLSADVAAVGDSLTGFDIYDSYDCGDTCGGAAPDWVTVGGTSLASPIIAGVYALAGGAQGVPYPALTLYGHLGKAYDVAVGGNGWCGGPGAAGCNEPNTQGYGVVDCAYTADGIPNVGDRACDALSGYDGPTGVGTPNGLTAFTRTGPAAKIGGPISLTHGNLATWTAITLDPFPGGAVTSYTWDWGDGTTPTVTTTASASHVYSTGGVNRTITLTVTDNYTMTGTKTRVVAVH